VSWKPDPEPSFVPYQALSGLPGQALLVLAPHPDDEVFGCGGLLAFAAAQGARRRVLVLTDGAAGGNASEREAESRRAAAALGYLTDAAQLQFLRHPDRGLQPDDRLLTELSQHADELGADLVLAPSPFEIHPDHRASCAAAIELARQRKCGLMFYEVGQPLMPNRLLDLSPWLERKRSAIACFESQLAVQAYGEHNLALNRFRSYTLGAEVTHAEAYWLLEQHELEQGRTAVLKALGADLDRRLVPVTPDVGAEAGATEPALKEGPLPSVSVLVRSMDRDSLGAALESLKAQGLPDLQVLVLNATGNPHRPLPDVGLEQVQFLDDGRAMDRPAAANRLLDAAGTECVLFLDDDDQLLPGHLRRLALALQSHDEAVAAFADTDYGRWVEGLWRSQHQFADGFDRWRLLFENYLPMHAVLFRRLPGLRFDPALPVFEDWDLWLQLASRGLLVHVPGIGARYVAGAEANSGVFETSQRNAGHAQSLQARWLKRLDAEASAAFLQYVRDLYRSCCETRQTLAAAEQGHSATREVLLAREQELTNLFQAHQGALRLVGAREFELENALKEQQGVRDVLNARDAEIANWRQHCAALEAELAQLKSLSPWQSFQAARRRKKVER